jgi:hypothetical protein
MKQGVRSFGIVSSARYAQAVEQQRKAESRAAKLENQLEVTRAESRGWKVKADQAVDAARQAQASAAEAKKQLQRAEKLRAEAEERGARKAERAADLDLLQKRLADAERELRIAREQLMAVEVKLDILEGAANVLDARTRSAVARRTTSERGAPV